MQLDAVKYLLDIQKAIADIEMFFAEVKSFNDYTGNKLLKAGVERKLLIIGEAVNRFRAIEENQQIEQANKIYGLRNRLAHAYDSIDDNTVYTIVVNHLPYLKAEVNKLIDENYKGNK
ncbi:MAG: DUF86 domain-containing protein [Chitinophagales bacterium]|nr:DUF86 domain-containing protein [Chitinophagales bacterium]